MRIHFDEPVVSYMTRDLEVAHVDTPVEQIARTMQARSISGLPILDSKGNPVGVITRTDLIQLGLLQARRRPGNHVMTLPNRRASDVMTHGVAEVASSASLRYAARLMVDHEIHRVFVNEGGKLAGVICAVDLTVAVRDARLEAPVSSVMTSRIVAIDIKQPLSAAIDLLDRSHVTGLIVTDENQPIGMFTLVDLLRRVVLAGKPLTTPLAGDSTSTVALSVSISARTSPFLTASPSFLTLRTRVPSAMSKPSLGIGTSSGMAVS